MATISIPGSKSITNRALILAALAEGESVLHGALDSEDTRVMAQCLTDLGFQVAMDAQSQTVQITGLGGCIPATVASLYLANSGTSIRFLTALTALGVGEFHLDGVERMRQRPQKELLDALQEMGVDARSENSESPGCPPLHVAGSGHIRGGKVTLNAEASSQFLTAILMVAPFAENDVKIRIEGVLRPFYVDITRRMMEHWGVFVGASSYESSPYFHVIAGQRYVAQQSYQIEPDASSASYFFGAAAITGGMITVPGLGRDALQGDVRFATEVLTEMGCRVTEHAGGITVKGPSPAMGGLRGVDRDMSAISDTSLTLAAIAPFATTPTTIRNIAHARKQECDRISAVCMELTRLGVKVEEMSDGLKIWPLGELNTVPAAIETYRDHRVAMSMALIGLRCPGVEILDPGCVMKTFPNFWERLEALRAG